jgi:hypothetical protein
MSSLLSLSFKSLDTNDRLLEMHENESSFRAMIWECYLNKSQSPAISHQWFKEMTGGENLFGLDGDTVFITPCLLYERGKLVWLFLTSCIEGVVYYLFLFLKVDLMKT